MPANWNGRKSTDLAQVSEHTIRALIARLHRQGLGSRSLQRQLSAIRSFYRWLMKEGFADHNPAASVRAPKAARKLPVTLDADAITRLLDIKDDSPLARRDRAIMELFYSSGLRLSELAGLQWTQIDFSSGLVTVTGKGNKTRMVPLGSYAAAALLEWRKVRGEFAGFEQAQVFVSNRGNPIATRTIQGPYQVLGPAPGLTAKSLSSPAAPQLRQPYAGVLPGISARFKNCWVTLIYQQPRSTPISIFSTWPASMTRLIHAPGRNEGVGVNLRGSHSGTLPGSVLLNVSAGFRQRFAILLPPDC